MEILGKIFGSEARVKIMRLFLSSNGEVFESKDVAKRSRVNPATTRKEIFLLSSVKFLKKNRKGWSYNPFFKYAIYMEQLLMGGDMLDKGALLDVFKRSGRIKLLLVAGTFIKDKDSRLDLLIVGDKINRRAVEEGLKKLEAEIGKELVYAVFETKEFLYRYNMYDKLIRDVLDFPHEVIIETKELSTHFLKKA